ncbi:MAG: class II fructose-bisphosphate aldolase [Candidatus Moraniibacteriota bacterium]|nr:MAG: class II fructose-bisphosphate aldolase [Candidatus Moranbacteria bacterium]
MIENVADMLVEARRERYAVGAFNVMNLETTHAVLLAAKKIRVPVILQFTESTMRYIGGRAIFYTIKNLSEWYYPDVRVGIHLDHGKNIKVIQRCLEMGLPSVMFDGSRRDYEENIRLTAEVVRMGHNRGASVQGELGSVPYSSEMKDIEIDWDKYMTDPDQARDFVARTGVNTLAVAIGNAHGLARERVTPDYDRLSRIVEKINIPIVMHGASDWEKDRVHEVVSRGVSCFNVDTNSRVAFAGSLSRAFQKEIKLNTDLRQILGDARDTMQEAVEKKMRMFSME